jgi:hypothetical protein
VEAISLLLSRIFPRRPTAELCEDDRRCQWWKVNAAGHRRLAEVAGFEVIRAAPPFLEPFGQGHPAAHPGPRSPRETARAALHRLSLGGDGVPHAALLARPRPLRV